MMRAQQAGRVRMRAWSRAAGPTPIATQSSDRDTKCPNILGHVATTSRPIQVATSKLGRDFISPAKPQARSRLHSQVATSWLTKPGRDVNPMSQPPLRPQANQTKKNQVALSKPGRYPKQIRPSRDHKTGSRPQLVLTCNDLFFPGRNPARS